MPYKDETNKQALNAGVFPDDPGDLNYVITRHADEYLATHGLNYRTINDILGALEGAKQEFYRRIAVPYEDLKRAENGEVYHAGVAELDVVLTDDHFKNYDA